MTNLNEQPSKLFSHTQLDLQKITVGTKVFSADGAEIGEAVRLHRRTSEVNADLKLYEFYLECMQPKMGNSGYIPADFIKLIDAELQLSATLKDVEEERWHVEPPFIAHKQGEVIELGKR